MGMSKVSQAELVERWAKLNSMQKKSLLGVGVDDMLVMVTNAHCKRHELKNPCEGVPKRRSRSASNGFVPIPTEEKHDPPVR